MTAAQWYAETWDEIQDAAHKAVVDANVQTRDALRSAAPVDDAEMRNGIRVVKKPGRNGPMIVSSVYVTGRQVLTKGRRRGGKGVANQLVANATNARTGWAEGITGRWEGLVQASFDKFIGG